MAEQLICNQQVVGSTPITSSSDIRRRHRRRCHQLHRGAFPSGQRGQTVNLLRLLRWFESTRSHQTKAPDLVSGAFVWCVVALRDTAWLKEFGTNSFPHTNVCEANSRALRGAIRFHQKKAHIVYQDNVCFFQRNKSLVGFVKSTPCVKCAPRVKCAAAREGVYFISHCDEGAIFHNSQVNYFTFGTDEYFTDLCVRFFAFVNSPILPPRFWRKQDQHGHKLKSADKHCKGKQ